MMTKRNVGASAKTWKTIAANREHLKKMDRSDAVPWFLLHNSDNKTHLDPNYQASWSRLYELSPSYELISFQYFNSESLGGHMIPLYQFVV